MSKQYSVQQQNALTQAAIKQTAAWDDISTGYDRPHTSAARASAMGLCKKVLQELNRGASWRNGCIRML
ncbi:MULTISPECIES: hypothetical protein [Janthinobacterium]|uniref:hypothetical protein n=1 Tax=Janthinobacterium TaxID=29580 RepID=UPI001C5A8C70|nr:MULTISPECIES: hypothetical protein [Janthinobacterium]MBW3509310.1 hypothetical protein [Janthinobacterium sp. NKUCC06_STL]MCA1859430.1 hypothetical protein [Janthinobacterium lividum]